MPARLRIRKKPGYLHVTVTGENSAANVRRYLADVHAACKQRKCTAVLIEENLRGPGLSIPSIHQVVTQAGADVWPVVQRIAYVDVNKEHDQTRMKFAETVALNRGVNVRVFTSVADAQRWMLDSAGADESR